jgi:hypothetical protein
MYLPRSQGGNPAEVSQNGAGAAMSRLHAESAGCPTPARGEAFQFLEIHAILD